MSAQFVKDLTILSAVVGFASAVCWFRGSVVKVSHERAIQIRTAEANKRGEKPNLSALIMNGADVEATSAAQSRWNAIGAFLSGCAILLQSVAQPIT
jgi:hypothetical protein